VIHQPFVAATPRPSRKKWQVFGKRCRARPSRIGDVLAMKTTTISRTRQDRRGSSRARPVISRAPGVKITNVLVPIDFSERALEAVEFALPLIKRFGADLHLVHVFEPDYPFASMAAMPLLVPELEVGKRVRRHLKSVAKKYSIELRQENTHACKGRPFEEICRLARDRGIDLIVAATRGNTGLKHLVLGSTAERIVRYSPCPVLVVHPLNLKEKAGGNGKMTKRELCFGKILVPIDFSDCSMEGLAYAKALAKQFGSKLVLLNSVALQYYIASDEYARYDLPLLMQQSEKESRNQMRDLIEKTDWDGIEVESSLQIGHAGQQICARAIENHADLIVTSTHGTTGFKHVLVGSTAEYVVRHASCPVLIVPSHERPVLTSRKKN
jgi:nucleotide-binding universal stress UspA family protein